MAKSERGQPAPPTDSWAKITVVLLDRHVAYLDRFAVDIRLQHGFAISRAELIRALIEAASQSGVVLSDSANIGQMIEMLREVWSSGKRRKR
jgi:tryptophan synthase alpha subunit